VLREVLLDPGLHLVQLQRTLRLGLQAECVEFLREGVADQRHQRVVQRLVALGAEAGAVAQQRGERGLRDLRRAGDRQRAGGEQRQRRQPAGAGSAWHPHQQRMGLALELEREVAGRVADCPCTGFEPRTARALRHRRAPGDLPQQQHAGRCIGQLPRGPVHQAQGVAAQLGDGAVAQAADQHLALERRRFGGMAIERQQQPAQPGLAVVAALEVVFQRGARHDGGASGCVR
jgi:hypothetical protein